MRSSMALTVRSNSRSLPIDFANMRGIQFIEQMDRDVELPVIEPLVARVDAVELERPQRQRLVVVWSRLGRARACSQYQAATSAIVKRASTVIISRADNHRRRAAPRLDSAALRSGRPFGFGAFGPTAMGFPRPRQKRTHDSHRSNQPNAMSEG